MGLGFSGSFGLGMGCVSCSFQVEGLVLCVCVLFMSLRSISSPGVPRFCDHSVCDVVSSRCSVFAFFVCCLEFFKCIGYVCVILETTSMFNFLPSPLF